MAAAIDYACFPHIFVEVAAQCDTHTQNKLRFLSRQAKRDVDRLQGHTTFPLVFAGVLAQCDFDFKTQNKLRLLSSWAKREVDRHQTYRCTFSVQLPTEEGEAIVKFPPPRGGSFILSVPFQFSPTWAIPVFWTAEKEAARAADYISLDSLVDEAFALRHRAHRVEVDFDSFWWDHLATVMAKEGKVRYDSPMKTLETATTLELLHYGRYDLAIFRQLDMVFPDPPDAVIPPSVEKIVVFNMREECTCHYRLRHSCRIIHFEFEDDLPCLDDIGVCQMSLDLVTPSVEELKLKVYQSQEASVYLEAISSKPLNPHLSVSVVAVCEEELEDPKPAVRGTELLQSWSDMLKVPVTLETYPWKVWYEMRF
ncbi:hypothetical protein A1Q1_07285 [Trichosporon asahii var. asahii CBS 2479]|uniref:Uncharacterized protein n=1 Tax=Trichosporon asahii var. asahii (strain ATCC 90039 / CBS 2479 / JCM 2466 / KCTC 7840 / NBRC 103889/ NCYC 2677 / UAMH 7654) TaxID=1186058 RepID=J5RA94_TRIAS|nr:hypothetical protein A1Q1_07285 [Trichosporon asahii var. asahii CBS 2479]EJT51523.1 hypothetical protein A1Q1_07285 [Trichosporon asahii var. asahii CBS 2479]